MPMLKRLKKCNDIIKMGTNGEINLLNRPEHKQLAKILNTE